MSRMALSNMVGVILIVSLCPLLLQAQILFPLGNVTYWQRGSSVKLPWTYNFPTSSIFAVEIVFTKSGSTKPETLAESFGGAKLTSKDPSKFTIEGQATLVFKNANLDDHNGKYVLTVTLRGLGQRKSEVLVVILETPTAVTKCSTPLILKEGADFECLCNSTGGNPPPTASWYNGSKVISGPEHLKTTLSLKKITRYQAGNYTCIVKSHDLENESQIKVQMQYGPTKATLEPDGGKTVGIVGEPFILTCSASAFPRPDFTILHNGMDLKDNVENGVLTIESVTLKDDGRYECIAKNSVGNVTTSFTLTVREQTKSTPSVSQTTRKTTRNSTANEDSNCGTKWYIIVITFICGICFGMICLCAILLLRRRMKIKKDNPEPAPYEIPETQQKETEDNSAYQELELQNREPENSYQALRKTRRKVDNEIKIEDEAGYQELDKVRENNDNYQSLNRV